jgi:hypothetical protein
MNEHTKTTGLAVPATDRTRPMDAQADRSLCTPAAPADAGRSDLIRESAADAVLSIVIGLGLAMLTLHALDALFY